VGGFLVNSLFEELSRGGLFRVKVGLYLRVTDAEKERELFNVKMTETLDWKRPTCICLIKCIKGLFWQSLNLSKICDEQENAFELIYCKSSCFLFLI